MAFKGSGAFTGELSEYLYSMGASNFENLKTTIQ
jgi:hypothetical protein